MAAEAAALARTLRGSPGAVTAALEKVQERWHYLPPAALRAVARELDVPLSRVYGVATFYSTFSLVPRGRHLVHVCLGTACYVRGGANVAETLAEKLGTPLGHPTPDFRFQLEPVRCLGCCSLAPVVRVDGTTFGRTTPQDVPRLLSSVAGPGVTGADVTAPAVAEPGPGEPHVAQPEVGESHIGAPDREGGGGGP